MDLATGIHLDGDGARINTLYSAGIGFYKHMIVLYAPLANSSLLVFETVVYNIYEAFPRNKAVAPPFVFFTYATLL